MELYRYIPNSIITRCLEAELKKNCGVRLGESAVVSHNLHGNSLDSPGQIAVYTDLDAGHHYLGADSNSRFIHIDVFHEPAVIDPVYTARGIINSLQLYFSLYRDKHSHEFSVNMASKMTLSLSRNILLKTSCTTGTVLDIANHKSNLAKKNKVPQHHVHILMPLPESHQTVIMYVVDAVERSILSQGFEIRRVESIEHCKFKDVNASSTPGESTISDLYSEAIRSKFNQNCLQILLDLADYFGGLDNVYSFLDSLTRPKGLLIRNLNRCMDSGLKQTFTKMINLNFINKGIFSYHLSNEGKFLIDFMKFHRKELETEIKLAVRRYKIIRNTFGTYKHSLLKSRKTRFQNTKKTKPFNKNSWMDSIAIAETVISASVSKYLNCLPRLNIQKKDIKVFDKRAFSPIDTCITVDCSGSMTGHKIRAVSFLAEHFLLTSREKVGLIGFQEKDARVVVPFTRDYHKLKNAVSSIRPGGMTPLAKGIIESITLIKSKRARNPLLILVTDGLPNVPLYNNDAKKDALKAAEVIARNKIRLVCIGLIPNAEFMKELAAKGNGNLYILNELNKNSLLDIVSGEWKSYKN